MEKVLVIGASGVVGSELVNILKSQGHQVRTTTSKTAVQKDGIELVQLDVLTGTGLEKAFTGVDRVFALSPAGYAQHYEILSPIIQQAKKSRVKKMVLMTAMGVDAAPESGMRRAEIELEKSGLNYNILRPNWFMQNFHTFWIHGIKTQNKIFLPVGLAKGSFIDSRDISAVAAKLLFDDSYTKGALELTGPEALDHNEVAAKLSEVLGKKISYQEISNEEMLKGLLGAGLRQDYSEFLLMILGAFKAGYSAPISANVEKILGRKAHDFFKYVRDSKAAYL